MVKIVVIIANGSNSDKSSVAMTLATAARSRGHEVAVFLTSDGVYLAKDGYAKPTEVRPMKNLGELVASFIESKGIVWACTACVEHRALKAEEMLPGVVVVDGGPMLEWILSGAQIVTI